MAPIDRTWLVLPVGLSLLSMVACAPGPLDARDALPGPGHESWGQSALACQDSDDCGPGEACYENTCQPRQCEIPAQPSSAPLGPVHELIADLEVAALDGSSLRFYSPTASLAALDADGSAAASGAVDIIAGRPGSGELPAVGRVTPSQVLWTYTDDTTESVDLPALAARAAAGDLDRDGRDDIAMVTASGATFICGTAAKSCSQIAQVDVDVLDISVAWFGQDARVVLATESGLVSIGIEGDKVVAAMDEAIALDAADLDGDGVDEILALQASWWPWGDDRLAIYTWADGSLLEVGSAEFANSVDIAVGDLDGDLSPEVVALTTGGDVEIWRAEDLELHRVSSVSLSLDGDRIALHDRDNDSARATLVDGPVLVTGNPVPVLATSFPPYHGDHSKGVPGLSIGTFTGSDQSITNGVSLKLGVEVGYSIGGEGLLSAGFTAELSRRIATGSTRGQFLSVGDWLDIEAQPERFGDSYGVVLLGVGCYEAYRYRVTDPADRTGQLQGEELVVLVPVGGETSLWSSTRYNALAKFRGDLPEIDVATQLGNVSSYPTSPSTLDGRPVLHEDMVFPNPPTFGVSDVAEMGWTMTLEDHGSESTSERITVGGKVTAGVAGVKVGFSATLGNQVTRSVGFDNSTLIRGTTPPLVDDPTTPEDEYAAWGFSFAPILYRHHYRTADGSEGAFYALSFTRSEP